MNRLLAIKFVTRRRLAKITGGGSRRGLSYLQNLEKFEVFVLCRVTDLISFSLNFPCRFNGWLARPAVTQFSKLSVAAF
jgi:hypothetical protein